MDSGTLLATLLPLALTSGVNLYATVLVIGLGARFDVIQTLPPGLDVLETTPILIIAGVLFVIEFIADKIQFVDQAWDAVHTFIRPVGSLLIASGLLNDADPTVRMALMMAVGGTTLVSHSAKASLRLVLNVLSPFENVSNTGISLAEDFGVITLVLLVFSYPYIALVIAIAILVVMIVFIPPMLRWMWLRLRAVWALIRGTVRRVSTSEYLPAPNAALLPAQTPDLNVRGVVHGIRGISGKEGFISVLGDTVYFTYDHLFKTRRWSLPRAATTAAELHRYRLLDVLEIDYADQQTVKFVFLKDRAPLTQRLAAMLGQGRSWTSN